jgi:hypothetical protein
MCTVSVNYHLNFLILLIPDKDSISMDYYIHITVYLGSDFLQRSHVALSGCGKVNGSPHALMQRAPYKMADQCPRWRT